MSALDWLFGRPLSVYEQESECIGPWAGVPILGLDALSSAAYGPEAALTLLLPLGALGIGYVAPITAIIVLVLFLVFFSYRQTIAAYPSGGGSYTVAKENLGQLAGLLAGAALAIDYVLNVAVGISSGVGAMVSAVPSLLPHTLALCLAILAVLTLVNLRGLSEAGLALAVPTYAFLVSLGAVVVLGVAKSALGAATAVVAPPHLATPTEAISLWILAKAFASGCTAMTGVEAVSNAVPVFREPRIPLARRTLTVIILALALLLGGIAWLCRVYAIGATVPGAPGYQSVLSMLTAAVVGRGAFYDVTMLSVIAVLALSANTSFADFPRLCHMLAHDGFLPDAFAVRGRRLVYTGGIAVLAVLSGGLLVLFGGVTDRLIPLFAIGAFLAFTLSQAGMVQHWRRTGGAGARRALWINAVGAAATGLTLVVIAVSKFAEGAWLTIFCVPLLVYLFLRVKRHYRRIEAQIATVAPLEPPERQPPVVVLPVASWNRVSQHGLSFALGLSSDVHVVQVRTETDDTEQLEGNWDLLIKSRARACGLCEPKLVILTSDFRQFFKPFIDYVLKLEREHPDREVVVVIPDLVLPHWYEALLHNNRGAFLQQMLRLRGSSRTVIVNTPYHVQAEGEPEPPPVPLLEP